MKKIIALLLILAMCLSFVACDSDKKKDDDDDDDVKTVKVDKTLCASCLEKMKGEWFSIDYDASSEDMVLNTFTITDDGKLIVDGNEYKLKFESCGKDYHNSAGAYDAEGNQIYNLSHNFDYVEDVDQQGIDFWHVENGESRKFRSMSKYTVVEITEENWQEYFSPEINDVFNVEHSLNLDKDEWGEYVSGEIGTYLVLKNHEKYAYDTTLAIEFAYETGKTYYDFDIAEEKVTNYSFTKTEAETQKETVSLQYDDWGSSVNLRTTFVRTYLNEETLLSGKYEEGWTRNPIEILRMKGWLVIRNDV